jgi:uncharacterized protein YjiS (DUF1127 family)
MDAVRHHSAHGALSETIGQISLFGLFDAVRRWRRIAAERDALARLDAHMLNDIGVGQAAAEREAARPFWDAPAGRYS